MSLEIWSINHFISFTSKTASSRTPKNHVTILYLVLIRLASLVASRASLLPGWLGCYGVQTWRERRTDKCSRFRLRLRVGSCDEFRRVSIDIAEIPLEFAHGLWGPHESDESRCKIWRYELGQSMRH